MEKIRCTLHNVTLSFDIFDLSASQSLLTEVLNFLH